MAARLCTSSVSVKLYTHFVVQVIFIATLATKWLPKHYSFHSLQCGGGGGEAAGRDVMGLARGLEFNMFTFNQ